MARRKILVAMAAVLASTAVSAAASQLGGASSSSLGGDSGSVSACASTGVRTAFVVDGLMVTGVEVRGLPAACTGKNVQVSVLTASGPGGESSGVVAGTTTTLVLGSSVPARLVQSVTVVVAG
jgi:hypothetical protein